MDPNPSKYPILSYLSRLPTFVSKPKSESDLENPPPSSPSPSHDEDLISSQLQSDLRSRMPHLNNPDLIQAMKQAVSNVSQTRSVLKLLGERPDHESVDTARFKIAEIEENLGKKIEDLLTGKQAEGGDVEEKEREYKQEAEREREIYRAVVKLDEMHESYEKLLREAEDKLERIYRNASEKEKGMDVIAEEEEEEQVNEEVVEILRLGEKGPERVDLSGRNLRAIPEAFGRLSGLVSLDLSNNELKTLPDSIAGLERLEELYLSSNLLESLPDSIGLLVNLRILNVSSNKLNALPDSVAHCRSLVELDASYNSLMYLPTNIGYELVNLTKLSAQYNKLRSLPSSICEMSSLRVLDVHFNELHGLPHAIGRLVNLEILDLSSNFSDLIDLPETFGDMMNLRELDLSNNQIHSLPNTFGQLDKLTKLNLDQNPIVVPPVEVVNKGTQAVKEFMAKRWLDILVEEEQKFRAEENDQAQIGWLTRSTTLLTRSTSALTSWASTVSENVTEYLGVKSPKDPYLNQQL